MCRWCCNGRFAKSTQSRRMSTTDILFYFILTVYFRNNSIKNQTKILFMWFICVYINFLWNCLWNKTVKIKSNQISVVAHSSWLRGFCKPPIGSSCTCLINHWSLVSTWRGQQYNKRNVAVLNFHLDIYHYKLFAVSSQFIKTRFNTTDSETKTSR